MHGTVNINGETTGQNSRGTVCRVGSAETQISELDGGDPRLRYEDALCLQERASGLGRQETRERDQGPERRGPSCSRREEGGVGAHHGMVSKVPKSEASSVERRGACVRV